MPTRASSSWKVPTEIPQSPVDSSNIYTLQRHMMNCPHSKLQLIIKTIAVIFQNSYLKHVGWFRMKEDGTLNIFINMMDLLQNIH